MLINTLFNIPNSPVTIATSLAPKDLNNQRRAINTWLRLGFKVVSINTQQEIDVLQAYFTDIEFVVPAKDASERFGRPYVYFDDVLAYLSKQESRICGIVNSDIYLINSNLHPFLCYEGLHSFIYGAKMDIKSLNIRQSTLNTWGYDYFFFDKQIIPYYPQEEFCIGLPWWDYWAPLIALKNNIPLKKIVTPIAYHLIHPTNYASRPMHELAYTLSKYFPDSVLPEEIMPTYGYFLRTMLSTNSKKFEINTMLASQKWLEQK
jgi:hypothetical protein